MKKKIFILSCLLIIVCLSAQIELAVGASDKIPIQASQYMERPPVSDETIAAGKDLYEKPCLVCHGIEGKGDGPVAFFLSRDFGPHPRNFTDGTFKFRSTPTGELPMDEDLFRTVTNGVEGYMPQFTGLDVADRWKVIYYVKTFSSDFQEAQLEPITIVGYPTPSSGMSVHAGYQEYQRLKCWECHGGGGEGNGSRAAELKDQWGFLLPPANLTMPNSFKNGQRPADLYRTLMTGLNGTAMPAYDAIFNGKEKDLWSLINYIESLCQERR